MLRYLIFLGVLLTPILAEVYLRRQCVPTADTIYSYNATLLDKTRVVDFSEYRGKVLLIVNTATYSNLTVPSFYQMNSLAQFYEDEDFEIIAFPTLDFNREELGANYSEIMNGLKYVRPGNGFEPKATFFSYVNVNGANEHPLYAYLKAHCPLVDTTYHTQVGNGLFYSPLQVGDVSWNFEKFLITREGVPYARYHPTNTDASALEPDISALLVEQSPFKSL